MPLALAKQNKLSNMSKLRRYDMTMLIYKMSSVSKLSNISKVSYVLSNMSKVNRCYASNCSEIRIT